LHGLFVARKAYEPATSRLAVAGAILSLPNISLFYGLHHWTEETFGFGARAIAVIDAATGHRPLATASVSPREALLFGVVLSVVSLGVMAVWVGVSVLAVILWTVYNYVSAT
jgi:hypothetical protein